MILGAMGPGEPVYGRNLNALPFHAVEPQGFTPYTFNMLVNPLDPRIDRAVATLGDLGSSQTSFNSANFLYDTWTLLDRLPT